MPTTPLQEARMKEKRDGHWSRPSSALAGGGASLLKMVLTRSMVVDGGSVSRSVEGERGVPSVETSRLEEAIYELYFLLVFLT